MPLSWITDKEFNYTSKKSEDFTLVNIKQALEKLGNPQDKLQNIIHIGGTNGKGSTCAILESILQKSGYIVHKYTSPHILKINERISIGGDYITDSQLERIGNIVQKYSENLTFFEILTVIAIYAFSEKYHDFCIIEVGLGGKLDSTNVFSSKLMSIITSISLDHTAILGNKIEEIATDKSGIINGSEFTIFANNCGNNVLDIIKNAAEKTKFYALNQDFFANKNIHNSFDFTNGNIKIQNLQCKLSGDHQIENCALATQASILLSQTHSNITIDSIKHGLKSSKNLGRLDKLDADILQNIFTDASNMSFYVDCAHNIDGIAKLCTHIKENSKNRIKIAIFSHTKEKFLPEIYKNIKSTDFRSVYITEIQNNPRAAELKDIESECDKFNINYISKPTISDILDDIKDITNADIYLFGSIFFVSDFYNKISNLRSKNM